MSLSKSTAMMRDAMGARSRTAMETETGFIVDGRRMTALQRARWVRHEFFFRVRSTCDAIRCASVVSAKSICVIRDRIQNQRVMSPLQGFQTFIRFYPG